MLQKKILWLSVICILLTCLSMFGGMNFIVPEAIFKWGSPDAEVFWRVRMPRVVAAFLSGAGLSMAGMVFQAMFRNPLAGPFTLGVSSGASFGAALFFAMGAVGGGVVASLGGMGAAFVGSLISMLLVYLITRARGVFSASVMLLAGVIINFFFSSLVMFIQYISASYDAMRIMHWLMGSLTGLDLFRLPDLCFVVLFCALILRRLASEIDLLLMGEELAASRGMEVKRVKLQLFSVSSLLVAAIVSVAGPIGFVGLMVPHFCRFWLGNTVTHRYLLTAVFFGGGCFLALCDLLARSVLAPAELPIGIVTSLIGAPFFLWILFHCNKDGNIF